MDNLSPYEMLSKHGNWIDSKIFISEVAKKRNIGERQAYNLLLKDQRIKKFVYQDRSVSYGLVEFGPPIKQENIVQIKPLIIEKRSRIWTFIAVILAIFVFGIFGIAQQDRSLKWLNDTVFNPVFNTSIFNVLLPIGALAGYAIIKGLHDRRLPK